MKKIEISVALITFFVLYSVYGDVKTASNHVEIDLNSKIITLEVPVPYSLANKTIANKIQTIILETEAKKMHLDISNQDLNVIADKYLESGNVNSHTINAIHTKLNTIISGLKKVYIENKNPDLVYNNLKIKMQKAEWLSWVKKYDSQEKISILENSIPHSVEQAKNQTKVFLKKLVIQWLFLEKAKRTLSPTSLEINNFIKTSKGLGKNKEKAAQLLLQMKYTDWWKTTVNKYKISVPFDYQEALLLAEKPPCLQLPTGFEKFLTNYFKL